MKKAIIENASKVEYMPDTRSLMTHGYAEGENLTVSDGYHTFDELYDHRITLFIALCKEFAANRFEDVVWRSETHSDGSKYDGWFILGIHKTEGKQITYHLPMERWDETEFAETLETAPKFDGHTSADVLNRLKAL